MERMIVIIMGLVQILLDLLHVLVKMASLEMDALVQVRVMYVPTEVCRMNHELCPPV